MPLAIPDGQVMQSMNSGSSQYDIWVHTENKLLGVNIPGDS